MDGDEEPTEMTAMTPARSAPDVEDVCDSGLEVEGDDRRTSWDQCSAFVKRLVKTPRGKVVTFATVTLIAMFLVLILAKIVAGSLHIGSCDLDPFVPVYMVSSGVLFLCFLAALLLVCVKCRHQGEDESDDRVSPLHLLVLFYFFIHIVLQLAGSVCVIRAWNDLLDLQSSDEASPATQSTVIAQQTVKLSSVEVTPAYPLMEPVLRVAPVMVGPVRPQPTCSFELLDIAVTAVILELIVSGLFSIFIVVSLLELAYIVFYEPTYGVKKAIVKANQSVSA